MNTSTIAVDAMKVVVVTENAGGYLAGVCIACDASGYLMDARNGYPHRVKKSVLGNSLIHKPDCPMNDVLNDNGSFKK